MHGEQFNYFLSAMSEGKRRLPPVGDHRGWDRRRGVRVGRGAEAQTMAAVLRAAEKAGG